MDKEDLDELLARLAEDRAEIPGAFGSPTDDPDGATEGRVASGSASIPKP